jgi:hypothetical protein
LPLIPEFNTEADRTASRKLLEQMGIQKFDPFPYRVK